MAKTVASKSSTSKAGQAKTTKQAKTAKPASKKTKDVEPTKSLKQGDKVEWNTAQGKTKGTVKQKISKSMKVEDYKVKASENAPQFLVESEKTGKKAAHKARALKKLESK